MAYWALNIESCVEIIVSCAFVVDAMLGTLAKWLRLLGYDTLFDPELNDHQLVRIARAEGRVLLTRDQELARRRGLRVLLVTSERLDEQVKQILADLDLEPGHLYSRCPVCNGLLEAMDRQTARARVPAYVAQKHETFRSCPDCQRVYWRGTHWQQMEEKLGRFRPRVDSPKAESTSINQTDNQTEGG
jgi:uncharacterized protein with PIN domain